MPLLQYQKFWVSSHRSKTSTCDNANVMVYKSPKYSYCNLITTIQQELVKHIDSNKSLVIMGDFNIDVSKKRSGLEQFMAETFSCQQMIHEPTTDHGSTLDLIFSNCTGNYGTIETYWSDHKLVYFNT